VKRATNSVKLAAALLIIAVVYLTVVPVAWFFEHVIDARLARCEPWPDADRRVSTWVWHRHSLLFWQWWSSHTTVSRDTTGFRKKSRT